MAGSYHISLELNTLFGMETIGSLELGTEKDFAAQVFEELHGDDQVTGQGSFTLILTACEDGVKLPITMKRCNSDELAWNVKLIARELFKKYNLEADDPDN